MDGVIEISWVLVNLSMLILLFLHYVVKNILNDKITAAMLDFAKYGKTKVGRRGVFLQDFDFPKRYFTHFYMVSCLWSGTIFVGLILTKASLGFSPGFLFQYLVGERKNAMDWTSLFLSLMLVFCQGSRRLYECLYVCKFSAKAKINFLHYILGYYFYIFGAMTILLNVGPLEELPDGYFQMRHFVGILFFAFSSYLQHKSAAIVANLRSSPKDGRYMIPQGGLFCWISCPTYFAEILIYFALTFVIGFSHYSWRYIVLFVCLVHFGLAAQTQDWYHATFENYPRKRKALIPFLF